MRAQRRRRQASSSSRRTRRRSRRSFILVAELDIVKPGMAESSISSLEVRVACEGDAASMAVLLSQLGHPLPLERLTANLTMLGSLPSFGTFVALLQHQVVGMTSAFFTPVLHRPYPVGRVSVLVVHEAFTGRGIGAVLLRHAESFLRGHGCARVEVTSAAHRDAAHRFYRQHGYAQQGVRFSREFPSESSA